MDDLSRQQHGSESQQRNGFSLSAALRLLDSIENWLASLFELTEEEQKEAGIYLHNTHSSDKEKT